MKIDKVIAYLIVALLVGCTADEAGEQEEQGVLAFSTSIEDFDGGLLTRTNLAGNAFEDGDKIKLKIICPFSSSTEFGETTYGNSFDGLWLLKWNSGAWTTLTANDGYDINGDYKPSASPNIFERYLAQATPYVFTAQTWNEEQIFIAGNGTRVEQYSNVFHADQSKEANYKACDLMWAQTIQQTGSYNVHLSFKHVMSALTIKVVNESSVEISDKAVLTLEGMPDIDQAEVIVGDYYAAKSKVNSNNYGYQNKHACDVSQNGTVIGVATIDDDGKKASTTAFSSIAQTATYTACHANNIYRMIVPPCELKNHATLWLRDGEKRYSMQLSVMTFEAGKQYNITMTIK